jgi:hypothetical protein
VICSALLEKLFPHRAIHLQRQSSVEMKTAANNPPPLFGGSSGAQFRRI